MFSPLLKTIVESFRDWGRDCWCESGVDNTCGKRFEWQLGELPKGYDHKYIYSHIGYNLKLTDMQAAIGLAQLRKLDLFIHNRKKNYDYIYNKLSDLKHYLVLPKPSKNSDPSWFGFPIRIKNESPISRNQIINILNKKNIGTRLLFGGNLIKQPGYKNFIYKIPGTLINTDVVMNNVFWIGCYPGLKSKHLDYLSSLFHSEF